MSTIRPHSNERDELARQLPELVERDLPSGRQRQIQEFVMNEIHTPAVQRRHPHRRLALATSALTAAAVAAVAVGGFGVGRTPDRSPAQPTVGRPAARLTPVAQTFELAASYAAARPFTPPRPDQWIYIQDRSLTRNSLAKAKGQDQDVTRQTWIRVDGRKMAGFNSERNGALETWNQTSDYPALSKLPTDPQQLLSRLRAELQAPPPRLPGNARVIAAPLVRMDMNDQLFGRIADILSGYLLPPAVTAALWRAAALLPGGTRSAGTIEVGGRQVIAIGRIEDGLLSEQILVDPDTYDFVGYRSVVLKDHTVDVGGHQKITMKKGEVLDGTTRLAAAIVDAPGQTS